MKASIAVLTGALLAFSCAAADAQDAPGPGAQTWTPVDNCQTANALGPQVYSDVANNGPNAVGELKLLVSALQMCHSAPQGPQAPPQAAQAQGGGMVLDDGPDASGPPPDASDAPDAAPPDDPNDAAPPDDSGASPGSSGGIVDDILQALESAEQMFMQYANPSGATMYAPGYAAPGYAAPGYVAPGSGYGPSSAHGGSGYGQSQSDDRSVPRYGSSYERALQPYARSGYGASSYGRPSYGQPSYAQPGRGAASAAYRRSAGSYERAPSYARGGTALVRRSYERISRAASALHASRAASALAHFLR